MKGIKKIDLYLLRNFLSLLFATFFICVFILLMQFMWLHVKDLVGKGIEIKVLMEFFVYAVCSVVPLALPLAILLASLISFGNLGENFELTAMKAAGISLFRIMSPLAIGVALISVGAFFFSNNVLPRSQVKLWALVFSLRQKSPELDIPIGEFYDGIPGYTIYTGDKNARTGMLYDMMIYNYRDGFQNATVTVADSGRFCVTADKHYLVLDLYDGESFENLSRMQSNRRQRNVPYRREMFGHKQALMDFSTELRRYEDDILDDQHVSKGYSRLVRSIDSVSVLAHQRSREQANTLVNSRYLNRDRQNNLQLIAPTPEETQAQTFNIDSLYATLTPEQQRSILATARERAQQQKDQIDYNALMLEDHKSYVRKHQIELYRKFTLAFGCLVFFFIGAPLGAIIRKGGLGAPVVISVIMFLIYYLIDNFGYKMAREALWPCWQGMWLSSFVLLPVGIFLTYKAATDSALFNPEAWLIRYQKLKKYTYKKWIQYKKR